MPTATEKKPTCIDHVAGLIEQHWQTRTLKMDWLGMESALREVLALSRAGRIHDDHAVQLCCEVIESFTRRGDIEPDYDAASFDYTALEAALAPET